MAGTVLGPRLSRADSGSRGAQVPHRMAACRGPVGGGEDFPGWVGGEGRCSSWIWGP